MYVSEKYIKEGFIGSSVYEKIVEKLEHEAKHAQQKLFKYLFRNVRIMGRKAYDYEKEKLEKELQEKKEKLEKAKLMRKMKKD